MRLRALIATMEASRQMREKRLATLVESENLQAVPMPKTGYARPVVLDPTKARKARTTATPNVLRERSRQQVPAPARIATTENTKTKEARAHANRAGPESLQPISMNRSPYARIALLDAFKSREDRTRASTNVVQVRIR
jgi:hypothetical protein